MPIKRKLVAEATGSPALKKVAMSTSKPMAESSRPEERSGIVQRAYYPPEMSNERCAQYNNNELPRPIEVLNRAIETTFEARKKIPVGDAVIHWYKRDLRLKDNRSLHLASEKAKSAGVPLICLFIASPQDYRAHLTSAPRVDFEIRTLEIMKQDLAEKDIPLHVETVEVRKNVPDRIVELCSKWGAKHVFCNIEYEVDELRREAKLTNLCLEKGVDFTTVHDDVIVAPGILKTGQGKVYTVYSPWYRAWVRHLHSNPEILEESPEPTQNPRDTREKFADIFDVSLPLAPEDKRLGEEEKERFEKLWPAGEIEAHDRLDKFLAQKASRYKDRRNFPASGSTATISVHLSAGTLAARTAVRRARDANTTMSLDAGSEGIKSWISEVAWRDFYKHILAQFPYVCMHKPFKYEYTNIEWDYDDDAFDKWCTGQTGFPIVDAAIRQMNYMGYMHNRCRMIVASFLAKDLLLDWRLGERYFMLHLMDADFASNNGGWGFSASTGVDPQPYFRIFNPLLQSEKFDQEGEYIRKWVPELAGIKGKAIHDPYGRGEAKAAEKVGYPKPMVNHAERRNIALQRYKDGLGRETA